MWLPGIINSIQFLKSEFDPLVNEALENAYREHEEREAFPARRSKEICICLNNPRSYKNYRSLKAFLALYF